MIFQIRNLKQGAKVTFSGVFRGLKNTQVQACSVHRLDDATHDLGGKRSPPTAFSFHVRQVVQEDPRLGFPYRKPGRLLFGSSFRKKAAFLLVQRFSGRACFSYEAGRG